MDFLLAIRELRRIAQPSLAKAPDKVLFPVHFTFRLVLERLESSLGSLDLLTGNDPIRHYHATGLICRNILSDALTTGYIIKSSVVVRNRREELDESASDQTDKSSTALEEKLHEKLYALYYDDLNRTDKFVALFNEVGALSKEDVEEYHAKHAMPNSMFKLIRDYAQEFGTKSLPSSAEMIKSLLKSDNKDHWVRELQLAFDIWTYFSKYEHLGWHAYDLTRDMDNSKVHSRLKSVTRLAALLQSSCHEMLEQKEALNESLAVYKHLLPFSTDTVVPND